MVIFFNWRYTRLSDMKVSYLFFAAGIFSATPCFSAPTVKDPSLKVEQVVSGLSSPTTMAFIGANDILVLQKNNGKVRRVIGGVLQAGEVLDVDVDNDSERGLLGLAIHPNFPTTSFVYLYYTESSTGSDGGSPLGNRVYRYSWNGSALVSPLLILDLPATPGPNHDGGVITFGPDGKLYVIIGDLNRNGQLQNFSNGLPDDTSVILRLNDDGSVPTDNPFPLGDPVNRYYAYGIRNSFGMAFDPVTGKLWDTENGPDEYDEINLVEPGFNSGWEKIMGPDSRDPQGVGNLFSIPGSDYADPKFSWRNPIGVAAIVFLDSTELGDEYADDVFVSNVNNTNLYRFRPNATRDGFIFSSAGLMDVVADSGDSSAEIIFGTGFNGITDLKVGPDGLLYALSLFEGTIYRISLTDPPPFFITASPLPDGEVGVSYSADLEIDGGTPPYTVTAVKKPNWLTTVDASGISGIPGRADKFFISLRVTDDLGASVKKQFKITVRRAVEIANRNLKTGRANQPYIAQLTAIRGKQPYTWELISGTLPTGLGLAPDGSITGTPAVSESQMITVQVTDSLGGTDQETLTLTINP
jgi:glucose/arabinose dehydrogenase